MGISRELSPGDLDTSQPGIRQIQAWIKGGLPVSVRLSNGTEVSGRPIWIDGHFFCLEPDQGAPSILINRDAIILLRPLA